MVFFFGSIHFFFLIYFFHILFPVDSVPFWGYHHTHRENLFEGAFPSDFSFSLSTDLENEKFDFLCHDEDSVFDELKIDGKRELKIKKSENVNDINDIKYMNNEKNNNNIKYNTKNNIKNIKRNSKDNINNKLFRILHRQIEYGNQIFSIHFHKLNLNFIRKHYGGGNGIECSSEKFVVVGSESRLTEKQG